MAKPKTIKSKGKGWFKQPIRHSRARKYGRAGGIYKTNNKKKLGFKYNTPIFTLPTICHIIGKEKGLDTLRLHHFIKFMKTRFPKETDLSYINEWADRFKKGVEWEYSDKESKQILYNIYPYTYIDKRKKVLSKGDYVAVHKGITTDPYNRRGQIGVVDAIDANNIVTIKFSDGKKAKYEYDTLIPLKS